MKKLIKKYKTFFVDIFLNTLAFGIYIFSQQIILLPLLAKYTPEAVYAKYLIYISLLNLLCNSVGSQLGVTRQIGVDDQDREEEYFTALTILSTLVGIVSIIFLAIIDYGIIEIIVLTTTILLSNRRCYVRYLYRMEGKYQNIIYQNMLYLFGIGVGLLAFYFKVIFWLPMMLAEIATLVYDLTQRKVSIKPLKYTSGVKNIFKKFSGYNISNLLSNACTLIDKILISPLLGQFNLIVYTVGNTVSKFMALITNPIEDVILTWISKLKNNSSKIIILAINFSLIMIVVFSVVTVPIIYLVTKILYSQYLVNVKDIMYYLSISGAISFASSMMKSFVVRYSKSIKLVNVYLIHIIVFTVFGYVGVKLYGLTGFVISTIFSRLQLLIAFIVILKKVLNEKGKETSERM